jgi:hypothetical protein
MLVRDKYLKIRTNGVRWPLGDNVKSNGDPWPRGLKQRKAWLPRKEEPWENSECENVPEKNPRGRYLTLIQFLIKIMNRKIEAGKGDKVASLLFLVFLLDWIWGAQFCSGWMSWALWGQMPHMGEWSGESLEENAGGDSGVQILICLHPNTFSPSCFLLLSIHLWLS